MIVVSGLSWWQSWLCVWLGYTIAACFVVMTGRIGATYHISFPVVTRSSFGIWGGTSTLLETLSFHKRREFKSAPESQSFTFRGNFSQNAFYAHQFSSEA